MMPAGAGNGMPSSHLGRPERNQGGPEYCDGELRDQQHRPDPQAERQAPKPVASGSRGGCITGHCGASG